ncbi:MAG: hypothetical protein MUC49_13985 [Raineya sp.]|jgi:hypothetical protein|nr:hypothetical protein [Raineya sp.]
MEITDEIEKNRIIQKISKNIDIGEYYDIHNLTSEDFLKKYGYWGFSFRNFYEIRFYNDTNVLTQLKKLTTDGKQYYFLPIDKEQRIYKDNIDFIDSLYPEDHLKAHIIIADEKLNWFLVKDGYNKLIGVGDYFKKRIKKMIHLKFDDERLMYADYDEK